MIERCHQLTLRVIQLLKLRLHAPLGLTKNFHFPSRSPFVTPKEIEGGGTNGGMKQGAVFDAEIASPESNKSVLHHVLGIGWAPDPLAGKQDQPGRELRKTDFPIFMGSDILHDPSRSLLLRRRQLSNLFMTNKFFLVRRLLRNCRHLNPLPKRLLCPHCRSRARLSRRESMGKEAGPSGLSVIARVSGSFSLGEKVRMRAFQLSARANGALSVT